MFVILHDFSGHPFQAELSRKLADAGHQVEHLSSEQYVSGKGHLEHQPDDSENVTFSSIAVDVPFEKYSPLARLRFERRYGRTWVKKLKADPPDVVIACNLPLISMFLFARYARRSQLPYVMWHQDIYSAGLADEVERKFTRPVARLGAGLFERMEAYCARHARHVVAIGDAFKNVYPAWKVAPENVTVIPNWAPLDKVFPVGRTNHRSAELFGDEPSLRFVYAGTLGRKHNPLLLVDLLRGAIDQGVPASMVVVSEGEYADELAAIGAHDPELPLRVVPFEPPDSLPDVLGSADVLVALLEPEATTFSIPSKVLSYMAAGRPILGLMPEDNPAAADIRSAGGHVAPPDREGVKNSVAWLAELHADREKVTRIGRRSREIAEMKFDVNTVAQRFDTILIRSRHDPT